MNKKGMGFINIFSHRLRPWDLVYWTSVYRGTLTIRTRIKKATRRQPFYKENQELFYHHLLGHFLTISADGAIINTTRYIRYIDLEILGIICIYI